jgi:hypothetical protein
MKFRKRQKDKRVQPPTDVQAVYVEQQHGLVVVEGVDVLGVVHVVLGGGGVARGVARQSEETLHFDEKVTSAASPFK